MGIFAKHFENGDFWPHIIQIPGNVKIYISQIKSRMKKQLYSDTEQGVLWKSFQFQSKKSKTILCVIVWFARIYLYQHLSYLSKLFDCVCVDIVPIILIYAACQGNMAKLFTVQTKRYVSSHIFQWLMKTTRHSTDF